MRRLTFLREDRAQFALPMLIGILLIFVIGALSLDVGLWYFAHRDAQNDADAAALAAALELPADDTTIAQGKADAILAANGAETTRDGSCPTDDDHSHIQFTKVNGSTKYNQVTVCTRRKVSGMLASMSGINFVQISAQSTAKAGHAEIANVMPWFVVAPQPTCGPGQTCKDSLGASCSFDQCPYGVDENKLIVFKADAGFTPGNFGAILACQGPSSYEDCIAGTGIPVGFFAVGTGVGVKTDPGKNGKATYDGLEARYVSESSHTDCDIDVHPRISSGSDAGWDKSGHDAAKAKYTAITAGECAHRLVLVPILDQLSNGKNSPNVIGIATFAIAGWDRDSPHTDAQSTAAVPCGGNVPKKVDTYSCGSVWGFFIRDAIPPDFLLERIDNGNNPLGPILIALTN